MDLKEKVDTFLTPASVCQLVPMRLVKKQEYAESFLAYFKPVLAEVLQFTRKKLTKWE